MEEGTTAKCCKKWNVKLNAEINWHKTFNMTQGIPEIKLKWFQIRVIHRILPTNVVLSCMGVKADNRCSFCLREKDSIEHMLWRCIHVNTFWNQFQQLIREKCGHNSSFMLNEIIVIFGNSPGFSSDKILDLILMLAKFYIYTCKIREEIPQIRVFKRLLKARYEIEKYIAFINLDSVSFHTKWQYYKQLIDTDN